MKRIVYKSENNIIVFRSGKTTNKKIASPEDNIVQTYTFSRNQLNYVIECRERLEKIEFKKFFSLDAENCGDCPFAANSKFNTKKIGKCYTHKVMQYSGFVSMLKSIAKEYDCFDNIPKLSEDIYSDILKICNKKYVRFGTYGEPTEIDLNLISDITNISSTWTGYTHQYIRKTEYLNYFMASVHNESQSKMVQNRWNGRSFIASKSGDENAVVCPASNEAGFKSTCAKCGLCSGIMGKGKKDVKILEH